MPLSDTVKIVCVVVAPIVFFAVLFGLAIFYRRRTGGTLVRHQEHGILSPRQPRQYSQCDDCIGERAVLGNQSGNTNHVGISSAARLSVIGLNDQAKRRKSSVTQPHFAERTTEVRRLSCNPQDDITQRVNSITSTLLASDDPASDALPYGGRKSSVRLPMHHEQLKSAEGAIGMGERRPSLLSEPDVGMLNVRRVSVGGGEDVVIVRSGSQSSQARRQTLEPVTMDFSEAVETIIPPALSPSHPFSTPFAPPKDNVVQAQHLKLAAPPTTKAVFRPDSIDLAKVKASSRYSAAPTSTIEPVVPNTCGSMEALKSPPQTAFSDDSDEHTETGIFQAWKGFPPSTSQEISKSDARPEGDIGDTAPDTIRPALSPRTPLQVSSRISPTLTFPEPSHYLKGAAAQGIPLPSLTVTLDSNPVDPNIDFSAAPPDQLTPAFTPFTITSSPASPSNPKSVNRITYLADVVRENEERRKTMQDDGSSIVAIASLETRKVMTP